MLTLPDFPVRQRDFLLEISRAITAQLDLSEVLRRVLEASVIMIAGRVGVIALHDAKDGSFRVRAYKGIQREQVADLNDQLNAFINTVSAGTERNQLDQQLKEMASSLNSDLVQAVAMPLVFADNPLGLLIVFRSYEASVTPNDMQILQSFADQAAIAVNNAQMFQRIKQEQQRLSAILQHSADGVVILNADLEILQVNRSFEQMTGWSTDQAVGQSLDAVIVWQKIEGQDLQDAVAQGWPTRRSVQAPHADTFYVEGDLLRQDGLTLSIGITYAPLFGQDGKLTTIIGNLRDITNFRRAQEMQNVFISTVSHELRTPVALIKGYASTLMRPDAQWNEDVIRNSLQVIEEESDRLTTLIDDLLTASRIQADHGVQLQLGDVRLDLIAASAVERLQLQTSKHRFVVSFPNGFPSMQGDAKLLRQVIENLITNAIKYSPNGGTITVGGRFTDENVTFFVRDEGVGIPETEMSRVFTRFYRIDNKWAATTKGTGLGLFLAKSIIEAHGGTINVKSQVDHGSTFFFTIPRD
ncbi:MAG: PAS domain S-box protein [Anaerolineae bacterium]|nr:PAS domain S-box protein [Anaerolineae bacterium]MCA9887134.1 PAS domain S-box protein [Anaerolineae bacterium]MCA9893460.1 PAS domain S-box protein [Anaerolineae bacterium]MCB9459445.1 PAS domain S-box protein [Anaerolineaceae bacterium]